MFKIALVGGLLIALGRRLGAGGKRKQRRAVSRSCTAESGLGLMPAAQGRDSDIDETSGETYDHEKACCLCFVRTEGDWWLGVKEREPRRHPHAAGEVPRGRRYQVTNYHILNPQRRDHSGPSPSPPGSTFPALFHSKSSVASREDTMLT